MIWQIAKREVSTRARTRAFQVLTTILLLGVIAAVAAIALLTGGDDDSASEVTIGVTGAGTQFSTVLGVGSPEIDPTIIETDDGETLLEEGEIDVLFTGTELVWETFSSSDIDFYVRTTIQQASFGDRAQELGLGPNDLGTLFADVPISERFIDGEDDEQTVRFAAAFVSTIAMFFVLQLWGSFMMMGVIEEKSSRVVEVLLSHIRPYTLLSGKILGLGILALTQVGMIIAGGVGALLAVQDVEIPDGVWETVPVLLLTFVLGFAFYSAIYAAVGSTVSRQEDATTAQLPAMLPLVVAYGIATSSISSPDSIIVTIASYVPFTSPIVLPFRVAAANPPIWEIGLSLLILAVSVPLMIRSAAQIYQSTLLNVGARIPLLQAIRNRNASA